jgi:hypothetical protein
VHSAAMRALRGQTYLQSGQRQNLLLKHPNALISGLFGK